MFRIEWHPPALDELSEIWMRSDSLARQKITLATNQLDSQLAGNPLQAGESRAGHERVVFLRPLGALIEVDVQRSVVFVMHVWTIR